MVVAFAAYWPALHGAFVWDDNAWTTKVLHLLHNARGLYLIWFDPTALQQYYPLSGTTFFGSIIISGNFGRSPTTSKMLSCI